MSYDVAGDWGTSRLRLYRIEAGRVVDRREGLGIGALRGSAEGVLRDALAPWLTDGAPRAIRLSGMVGSRNGWIDVPYLDCPVDRAAWRSAASRPSFDLAPLSIMAGLACTNRLGAPDVMRGEETQIFGAMAIDPALACGRHLIALPGTHSKWARVDDGRIIGFQTFFTGELFALLRDQSILTRLGDRGSDDGCGDRAGFDAGLARADDGQLLGALFEARAVQLRRGRPRDWAIGFLSGLLIGREVAEATVAAPGAVTLVGEPQLTGFYARALDRAAIAMTQHGGDACVLAGLAGEEMA